MSKLLLTKKLFQIQKTLKIVHDLLTDIMNYGAFFELDSPWSTFTKDCME